MDSRMGARLEDDLAKSACHEQTGGVPNGGMAVRVRAKCAGAWLCGGRGGSKGWEGMVREATVTSLEKASNSAFSLIGPETLKNYSKTGRRTRSRNFARAAPDLSGDGRSILLGKRGTCRASSVAGSIRRRSSLDPVKLAATADGEASLSAYCPEAGIPPSMANCRDELRTGQLLRPRP